MKSALRLLEVLTLGTALLLTMYYSLLHSVIPITLSIVITIIILWIVGVGLIYADFKFYPTLKVGVPNTPDHWYNHMGTAGLLLAVIGFVGSAIFGIALMFNGFDESYPVALEHKLEIYLFICFAAFLLGLLFRDKAK